MKRTLLYIVIISLSFAMPLERADVARLEPVEAVAVRKINNQVIIVTDTGNQGAGKTTEQALADLYQNAPSIIYLDTAKYLLINEEAVGEIDRLRKSVKSSVKLCKWSGPEELKSVVKYLTIHGQLPKLSEWEEGDDIPTYFSN